MSDFDRATAVVARTGLTPVRGGHVSDSLEVYDATIDSRWTIGGKPNGGYMLALLTQAGLASVGARGADHPHPLAATAHYLKAPLPGPVELRASALRIGRSASQVRVSAIQDGVPCVEALLTLGRLEGGQPWWRDGEPVELPPEDRCLRLPPQLPGGSIEVAIQRMIEVRVDPEVLGFADGRPGGHGELRAWLRFADRREPDPLSLVFVLDALPPATFDLGSIGWVPTLELTTYVRALPSPGPLRVRQRARLIQQGFVDEVCEVWDSDGRLVAQGSQLAGVRVPDQPPRQPPAPSTRQPPPQSSGQPVD
jgi:acyl-coenzyme A thioesterase PaaI-like protein